MDIAQPYTEEGKLTVAYSDASGQSLAVQFSAITSQQATYLIGSIYTATNRSNSQYIASDVSSGATVISMENVEGAGRMEERLAVLVNDVSHIKSSVSGIAFDAKKTFDEVAELKAGMSLVLQKLDGIERGLSTKADGGNVDIRIGNVEKDLAEKPSKAESREIVSKTECAIIKWMVGVSLTLCGVLIGALKFFIP